MPDLYDDTLDAGAFPGDADGDEPQKKKLAEDDPEVMDPAAEPDGDEAGTAGAAGGDHLQAAKNLIMAILDDPALSAAEFKEKINHVLELFDDGEPGAGENAATGAGLTDESDGDDEAAELEEDESQMSMNDTVVAKGLPAKKKPCDVEESWADPMLELEFRRGKDRARRLCEELRLPRKAQSESFVEALATFGEAKQREMITDRKALVQESRRAGEPLPKVAGKGRPKSASPAALREGLARKKPASLDDFLAEAGLRN